VNGGKQKRVFTYLDDGIDCLVKIIENKNNVCQKQIFNIGNPKNEMSIKDLATRLRELYLKHPLRNPSKKVPPLEIVREQAYYGKGYQDIQRRMPSIKKAQKLLGWTPKVDRDTAIRKTLDYFLKEHSSAR
jgi:UDP-4-amino-4-deoxy-L-arabinose formyltransferase/UDP-glucuronic acid dehydrogenase (UDP-4-keto-hexauronic acid decarboxylating)